MTDQDGPNPDGPDDEGIWMLFEDGRLEFHPSGRAQTTDMRARIKLASKVPISRVMPEIDVVRSTAIDPESLPAKSWPWNRLWVAKPNRRKVSWLQAIGILLKHRSAKHHEVEERLHDAESLILTGHAPLAIQRLSDWIEATPNIKSKAMGMLSLALWVDHQVEAARLAHIAALHQGCPHPAMIDQFGLDLNDGFDDVDEPFDDE